MADEEIVVRIVADDSELIASLANISDQAEGLDNVMGDVSENIADGFDAGGVEDYGDAVGGAEKNTKKLDATTKKGTRSMGRFTRGAGRGVSTLSRFSGVGGRATRSLAGMGMAMAGTPFGAFIILASAASAAISFFGKSAEDETKDIDGLRNSISGLNKQAGKLAREVNLLDIEMSTTDEIKKQRLIRKEISKDIKGLEGTIKSLTELEGLLNIAISKNPRGSKQRLKQEETLLRISAERKNAEIDLKKIGISKLKSLKTEQKLRDAAAKKSEKDAIMAQKLFDSLIRDELKKRLKALDTAAAAREKGFKKSKEDIKNREEAERQISKFTLQSQKILEEDKQKLKKEFLDAEINARKAIQLEIAAGDLEAEKLAIKQRFEQRQIEIGLLNETETEKANLLKKSKIKFDIDLAAIDLKTKTENLDNEQQYATARLELEQENDRQIFAQTKKTAGEISNFDKGQKEAAERLEIDFQIRRLKLILGSDKTITDSRKKALGEEIKLLEKRAEGIGVTIEKAGEKGKKKGGGLAAILGVKEDEQAAANAALQNLLDTSVDLIKKAVAERVAALQKEVDFRNQMIQEKQKNLDTEIELNKLGKASNIALAQEELQEQNKLRDKALREKKEAQEAQFAIDTALQASSLAVAIAQLYASLAGTGIGVAIATALSAVMIGAFIGAKAQAASAAGFAEGGYTGNGGKYTPAGTVHRGEYVLDKDTTAALGLQRVPMSEFTDVMGEHFSDMPNGQTVGKKNGKITSRLNTQIKQHKQQLLLSYEKGIKNALNGQNSILKGILAATENTPIVFPLGSDKYLIERGKHKKEIKRIKK